MELTKTPQSPSSSDSADRPVGTDLMSYVAHIEITLKPTVNDPQGLTIKGGLHLLGFKSVQDVRAGKYLELTLEAASQGEAEARVSEMCEKLLANPVIEQYRFTVEDGVAEPPSG